MSIEDNFYRLGTVHGVLKQLFSRNQFDLYKQNLLSLDDVKKDTEISIRSAVGKLSVSGATQGFVRCPCKKRCMNNKCTINAFLWGTRVTANVITGNYVAINNYPLDIFYHVFYITIVGAPAIHQKRLLLLKYLSILY